MPAECGAASDPRTTTVSEKTETETEIVTVNRTVAYSTVPKEKRG